MSTEDPQVKIGGYRYPVERVRVGQHTLGHVVIDEDLSVVFKMINGDVGGPSPDCTACKLGELIRCRDEVCPPIKKKDPKASCSDAIGACAERACPSCKKGVGGGDIIIIA
jgi:hypothetical protein